MQDNKQDAGGAARPAIATRDLVKVFPNGTRAVDGITCEVSRDDFLIVLGPSGAGKSTLLRCMNRLVEPTSGTVLLADRDITHVHGNRLRDVRGRVGMIFQQFNLVHRLTVLENVLAGRLRFTRFWQHPIRNGLSMLRVFPKAEREFAFECLRKVGIERLAFQRADTLSGGQQQRVAIARTLAQEPEVFLADEPIASLDPASAEVVMDTLQDIHEIQNIPIIVNLHHIDLATRYAKRILGMKDGKVVFEGGAKDLTRETVVRIYGDQLDVDRLCLRSETEGGRDVCVPPASPAPAVRVTEKPIVPTLAE